MPDSEHLDCEQRAAVEATEHAIAVLAGPGSGKTRTLSHRARHLLRTHPGDRALLLTFTNKAAAEMKARAVGTAAVASDRIDAGTFHGFGSRVLRAHGSHVEVPDDFEILDDQESRALARSVAQTAGIQDRFTSWQQARLRREDPQPSVAEFGRRYQEAKLVEGSLDFDDLVVLTAQLFEKHPEIAAAYGSRYAHLLVDEFQDTNAVQFAIVQALAAHCSTVSVFADDDQAIFRFTGADVANIRGFVDSLGATVYPLTCNYRSRARIVEVANALIAADPDASGRLMRADRDGGSAQARTFATMGEEARMIAEEIRSLLDDGRPPSSIAILARAGYRADEVFDALRREGIPITDWRDDTFDPSERRLFVTALSVVKGSLKGRRAHRLCELLGVQEQDEIDVDATLEGCADVDPLAQELLALRAMAFEGATPSQLGAQAKVAISKRDAQVADRLDPILASIADFERYNPEFTLDDLLSELALKSGGRPPTSGGGVRIATLHSTKGLQWPTVFLVGLETGHLPHYRSGEDELADERRACFVGVCRAEDRLVVTRCTIVNGRVQRPSIFIDEMHL